MLEYIPRAAVLSYLTDGWRLVAGHEYLPGDWAVLMRLDSLPEPLTASQIRTIANRFLPGVIGRGNKSAGAKSRIARLYPANPVQMETQG